MAYCIAYITAADRDEARTIAKALIEERLVACANILGDIESLYWWDRAVQNETEVSLIVKTRQVLMERVIERVKALHSYDCPCVVALPITDGNPAFLDWIAAETTNQVED